MRPNVGSLPISLPRHTGYVMDVRGVCEVYVKDMWGASERLVACVRYVRCMRWVRWVKRI